jgi:uncharacterized protein YuzE
MSKKTVKFEYDRESDAAYLRIRPGKIVESEEIEPGLIVDLGPDDEIVGVEILRFTRRFARQTKKLAS